MQITKQPAYFAATPVLCTQRLCHWIYFIEIFK